MSQTMHHDLVPISVVIPAYNASGRLAQLIHSLSQLKPQPAEIIVVDDGSNDGTFEKLRGALERLQNSLVLTKVNGGPASARNLGISHAGQPWVAFTDDDCLPEPDWLGAFQLAIDAQPAAACLFGSIRASGPVGPRYHYVENDGSGHQTANAVYRRDILLQVGGFDDRFPYAYLEDTDLFIRVSALAGWTFVPNAVVIHPSRPASLRSRVRRMKYLESDYMLFAKHPHIYRQRHRGMKPLVYHLYYFGLKHGLKVSMRTLKGLPTEPLNSLNVLAGVLLERLYLLYLSIVWSCKHG